MGMGHTFSLTLKGEREIHMTRQFQAPRDLVFKTFSSCEHYSRWMGPRDLTMESCAMELGQFAGGYTNHQDAGVPSRLLEFWSYEKN